ncbi:hypothetical protein HDU96_007976 [Phlyctochytrium bullatum]|nr:hypothetical protein HDU96_007976 [Phlyctochytrium bullatum]
MFKKRSKGNNALKRPRDDDEADEADDDTEIIRKKKESNAAIKVSSSTKSVKPVGDIQEKPTQVSFSASGSAASLDLDMATRTLDVDGREDDSAKAKVFSGEEAEGLYQGLNGYKEYVNKKVEKTTQSNASKLRAGPLKGLTNVRISCRFDYQQGICKDYKETGYCGFGDSCVFMHDRGDYKTGWQLDQEWDEMMKQKAKERLNPSKDDEDAEEEIDEDDDIPFTCPICTSDFKHPVITKCQHYFCENCAIANHAKSSKCFVCATPTGGSFNAARDLLKKIADKKKSLEERAKAVKERNVEAEAEDVE